MDRTYQPFNMYSAPVMIAREWFKKGSEESDAVFAFVSYWITFNQLYNYSVKGIEKDRERIHEFVGENIGILKSRIDFSSESLDIFMEAPVLDGLGCAPQLDWSRNERSLANDLYDAIGFRYDERACRAIAREHKAFFEDSTPTSTRIEILFNYIYQVRNNLFHGHKTPSPERDWRLVESSARVLEVCLPDLIEAVFGYG